MSVSPLNLRLRDLGDHVLALTLGAVLTVVPAAALFCGHCGWQVDENRSLAAGDTPALEGPSCHAQTPAESAQAAQPARAGATVVWLPGCCEESVNDASLQMPILRPAPGAMVHALQTSPTPLTHNPPSVLSPPFGIRSAPYVESGRLRLARHQLLLI